MKVIHLTRNEQIVMQRRIQEMKEAEDSVKEAKTREGAAYQDHRTQLDNFAVRYGLDPKKILHVSDDAEFLVGYE